MGWKGVSCWSVVYQRSNRWRRRCGWKNVLLWWLLLKTPPLNFLRLFFPEAFLQTKNVGIITKKQPLRFFFRFSVDGKGSCSDRLASVGGDLFLAYFNADSNRDRKRQGMPAEDATFWLNFSRTPPPQNIPTRHSFISGACCWGWWTVVQEIFLYTFIHSSKKTA